MDASTQTETATVQHFLQQTDGANGKWDNEYKMEKTNLKMKKTIIKTKKNVPCKKIKQNQQTQTIRTGTDKAIQTEWKLVPLDIPKSDEMARQNMLWWLMREEFYKKIFQEFEMPHILSPLLEDFYEDCLDKIGGDNEEWSKWKVGEFHWKEEDEMEINEIKEKEATQKGKEENTTNMKRKSDKNENEKENPNTKKIKRDNKENQHLSTLDEKNWLNDEVVNQYFELIANENNSVYPMSSFFFPRLHINGHSAVKRWTKKVNIFEFNLVLIPVHLGSHWCLAIIKMADKNIVFLDSLMGNHERYLQTLLKYLEEEAKEKSFKSFQKEEWRTTCRQDIPRQYNNYDCGVFTCAFAKYEAAGHKFNFTQENMEDIRKKIKEELILGKLIE